jgi:two-component system, LytTR family, response regulator
MNILIVEDEAPAARRLRRLVTAELGLEIDDIAVADNLDVAQQIIRETRIDLLLLDLDLSGLDGFDVLRATGAKKPATVIVSANIDRALDAFDHDVVDFVAKPVSAERLSRALARVREAQSGEMRLIVRAQGRTDIIPASLIVRISGAGDYIEIATTGGHIYLHDDRLEVLEKRLPPSFLRVHRSYIVNMAYALQLRTMDRDRRVLVMRNGEEIPVSRRRMSATRAALETLAASR